MYIREWVVDGVTYQERIPSDDDIQKREFIKEHDITTYRGYTEALYGKDAVDFADWISLRTK